MNIEFPIAHRSVISALMLATVLAAGALFVSCKTPSTPTRPWPDTSMYPDSADPSFAGLRPELVMDKVAEKQYYIGMNAGAGGASDSPDIIAVRKMRVALFRVYTPRGTPIDSMYVDNIPTSGTMNSETGKTSVMASAGVVYEPVPILEEGTYVDMVIYGVDGTFRSRRPLPVSAKVPTDRVRVPKSIMKPSIILVIEVSKLGQLVEFIVTSKRVGPIPEGEYLPTSEDVRIEITNDVGEVQWSSNDGRMYAEKIGQVQPQEIGKEYQARVHWDGKSSVTHAPLAAGRYRITATIPAKPKPYSVREEFTWGGITK